CMQALECPLTF
nr:immunoglobulin light chain junction region [Macaca mulatta]